MKNFDTRERFIGCNANFAAFAGETMESLIGKSEHEMPWKEHASHFIDDDQRVIRTGKPLVNYREVKPNDAGRHEILTNKYPFRNAQGEIIGVIGVFFII